MISQVVNLSNKKTFKLYKEKYVFSFPAQPGFFGVETRRLPPEVLDNAFNSKSKNIFRSNNDLLLTGSFKDILQKTTSAILDDKIKTAITNCFENFKKSENISYQLGNRNFDFNQAYVMGILNVTPDSFSDGGKFSDKDKAVEYAIEMIEAGADIVDVGGESTRPGSKSVSESEELNRVIPVINEILKKNADAVISIDTTKAKIAAEALKCGALIVNDISSGTFDNNIFNVVKDFNAAMVLMHMKGNPKTMQNSPVYIDVVSEIYDYLSMQTEAAKDIGIKNLFVDPGIGFGKRVEDNLTLIERLEDFKSLGFPILIGLSRKSFIGNILNLPPEDRDDVTNAMNSTAITKGARIIRTHNVKQAVQTCKIFNTMISN